MNHRDAAYANWRQQRQRVDVPECFSQRVMLALPPMRRPRWPSVLAVAAAFLLVAFCHIGTMGAILCAITGVAQ